MFSRNNFRHGVRCAAQSITVITALVIATDAFAGCWLEFRGLRTQFVCADTSGPGYHYSTIQIKNTCRYPIWVATTYRGMTCQDYPGNHSCLAQFIPDHELWASRGWWSLAPGQTKYIADTQNRNVYFYAETKAGSARNLVWKGSDHTASVRGESVSFFRSDIGGRHTNFTQTFSCSGYCSDGQCSETPQSGSHESPDAPSEDPAHSQTGGQSGDDGWDDDPIDDDWN